MTEAASAAEGPSSGQRTLVVLQPGYLPWLGYFDQVRRSDVFIFYDVVQYDSRGWRNRNRIKSREGKPIWLTVPVHANRNSRICEVEIDRQQDWAARHLKSLRHNYARAPFAGRYLPELESTLDAGWRSLADLDVAVARLMCAWLGLETEFVRATELPVEGGRSEGLLAYCRHFGATHYLTGDSARDYLDVRLFERNGVEVVWQDYRHPSYKQLHGDFMPFLSAIDLILNCGDESADIIASGSAEAAA